MRDQELNTVRRVLEAALQNLRQATGEGEVSSFTDRRPSSEGRSFEAPVIIIIAGDLNAHSQDTTLLTPIALGDTKEPAALNPGVSKYPERKLSHPELERFTMEADSHPSAPKACFMESGRTCVNSGACETRGF